MRNPWQDIPLSDYEGHMSLGHIYQLQALNELMDGQFRDFAAGTVMILGIAGSNGLEHIRSGGFHRVWGVDVNGEYLDAVHCQMEEDALAACLAAVGYGLIRRKDRPLPNGKKLVRLDFARMEPTQ